MSIRKVFLSFFLASLISVNAISEVVTNTSLGQIFKFKFELGKPLVYDFEVKTRSVGDSTIGTRSTLNRKTVDIHYKIRFAAVETNQDGVSVLLEPFDFTQSIDNIGANGHINTFYSGLDIISKQNDIVIIDTKNDIGLGQADPLKNSVFPYLLSGYLLFDSTGDVKNFSGDLPFTDVWQRSLKTNVGFFGIVFPTDSVSLNNSWTNTVLIKQAGGFTYGGNGITQSCAFVRGSDSIINANVIACFNLYETQNYQHLNAYIEQSGQQTSVDFPEFDESINGTFHFNQKTGQLVDLKKVEKKHDSINYMVQGNPATANDDIETEITMQLITP